ncbi:Protein yhjK [Salmonella enterica subsp. enterica]|uniref:Protein yhjK n=1 Tax=Salmonella enterica I TaxID=59201 RepID=A0A3S4GCN8_SALET|nr:Protein yhjK [Salmonella enterica subsp. enterica]
MYKFVMSALSYVSDHLLTFIADPDGGHRLVRKPPDCASAAQNRRELNDIPQQELIGHQLALPRLHQDDEIGMLVRSYNLQPAAYAASTRGANGQRDAFSGFRAAQ